MAGNAIAVIARRVTGVRTKVMFAAPFKIEGGERRTGNCPRHRTCFQVGLADAATPLSAMYGVPNAASHFRSVNLNIFRGSQHLFSVRSRGPSPRVRVS